MKLLIVTFVLISTNFKSSSAKFNFFDECIPINKHSTITYSGDNVLQVLNSQVGTDLFLPTENGLKLNVDTFTTLLGDCAKKNFDNKYLDNLIDKKNKDLTGLMNSVLADNEITFDNIDNLIDSTAVGVRTKRELSFPLDILQEILSVLIFRPLQILINNGLNAISSILFSFYTDPTNVTGTIPLFLVNTLNSLIEIATQFLSNIKFQINIILDSLSGTRTVPTRSVRSSDLQSGDIFSNALSSVIGYIVVPVNKTVNSVVESSKTAVSGLTKELSKNPMDNIVNGIFNTFIAMILDAINQLQNQIISFFNGLVNV